MPKAASAKAERKPISGDKRSKPAKSTENDKFAGKHAGKGKSTSNELPDGKIDGEERDESQIRSTKSNKTKAMPGYLIDQQLTAITTSPWMEEALFKPTMTLHFEAAKTPFEVMIRPRTSGQLSAAERRITEANIALIRTDDTPTAPRWMNEAIWAAAPREKQPWMFDDLGLSKLTKIELTEPLTVVNAMYATRSRPRVKPNVESGATADIKVLRLVFADHDEPEEWIDVAATWVNHRESDGCEAVEEGTRIVWPVDVDVKKTKVTS